MEFKGTKGKWKISTNNEEGILISTYPMSRDICTIWKYDNNFLENQESKSNALLISKAPEILEMLTKVECNMRINTQDEIDLWKSCKKLIKSATQL